MNRLSLPSGEHKRLVILTASAIAAAGLGSIAALTIIRRHRGDGDQVKIVGINPDDMQEVDREVESAEMADINKADVVYAGPNDDPEALAETSAEIHGLGIDKAPSASVRKLLDLILERGGFSYRDRGLR